MDNDTTTKLVHDLNWQIDYLMGPNTVMLRDLFRRSVTMIETQSAEITRLRELAAAAYAGLCAVHDLPEPWLDAFLAASSGESFTTEGLLPYEPEAPDYLCVCPKCYAVHDNRTLMTNVVIVRNSGENFAVPTHVTDLREFDSKPYVEDLNSSTACTLYEIKGPVR